MFHSRKIPVFLMILFCLTIPLSAKGGRDARAIESINRSLANYGQYLIDGEYEKWGELHSENVVKMLPNVPPTTNRKDLVANIRKDDGAVKIDSFNVDIKSMEVNGKYAQAWGLYTIEITPLTGGDSIFVDGKFLTLYHKEKDGRWVITHDCSNSNVPPDM